MDFVMNLLKKVTKVFLGCTFLSIFKSDRLSRKKKKNDFFSSRVDGRNWTENFFIIQNHSSSHLD